MFNRIRYIILTFAIIFITSDITFAVQYARPDGTVSSGVWSVAAGTLYDAINEATPDDDTTFISSGDDNDTAELTLSDVTDPADDTGHIIRFRVKSNKSGESCQVMLYQGTTLISTNSPVYSFTNATRNNWQTVTYALPTGEAASIADGYADLRFRIITGTLPNGATVQVTWAELEVPDSSGATAPTVTTGSATSIDTTTATLGGDVTDTGGEDATERGVYWSTSSGFTPPGQGTKDSTSGGPWGTGAFTESVVSLPAGSQVYFRAFAANTPGEGYGSEASFFTEPGEASGIGFENITSAGMRITWAAGTGGATVSSMVIVRQVGAVNFTPVDGTTYTPNSDFGSGTPLNTDNYVVFNGVGTQVDITGLASSTLYSVAVYAHVGSSPINYQQDGAPADNQSTTAGGATAPTVSSPVVDSMPTQTDVTLRATINNDGGADVTDRGFVWNTTGSPTLSDSFVLESGSWSISSGTPYSLSTGSVLTAATKYYFSGFATNPFGTSYTSDGVFYTEPSTQASAVGSSNIGNDDITINWTPGDGDGAIVIVRQGLPVDAGPDDGIVYTVANDYGNPLTEIGTGNYVIYAGNGASAVATALNFSTAYHFAVYEYKGTGSGNGGINYKLIPIRAEFTTNDPPIGHNYANGIGCMSTGCHSLHSTLVPRNAQQITTCVDSCHYVGGPGGNTSEVAVHTGGHADCGSCHQVHAGIRAETDLFAVDTHVGGLSEMNVKLVRANTTFWQPNALEDAVYHADPDPNTFLAFGTYYPLPATDRQIEPWTGVCQTCHTSTSHHRNDNTSDHDHPTVADNPDGKGCLDCHPHSEGFAPSGGGCTTCHSNPQDADDGGPTRRAVVGEFGAASHHVVGGTVTDDDCAVCHMESETDHKNNLVDLRNPDTGTAIPGFAQFSRANDNDFSDEPWVTNVQDLLCLKCHDADGATASNFSGNALQPFSSNSKDVPNVFDQFDTSHTFFHPVRGAGSNPYCTSTATNGDFITMESPWNQTADEHNLISCFDCHMTSGHGSDNQRMLTVNIDFDNMATLNQTTMGTPIRTFCTSCHKYSLYFDAKNPEDLGSAFPEHAGGKGNHGMPTNELSCMGCHAAPSDHGGLTGSNGAAPGLIHGGSYTWTESIANGYDTDYFVLGGYINGFYDTGTGGECGGGTCSHANGQSYSRP